MRTFEDKLAQGIEKVILARTGKFVDRKMRKIAEYIDMEKWIFSFYVNINAWIFRKTNSLFAYWIFKEGVKKKDCFSFSWVSVMKPFKAYLCICIRRYLTKRENNFFDTSPRKQMYSQLVQDFDRSCLQCLQESERLLPIYNRCWRVNKPLWRRMRIPCIYSIRNLLCWRLSWKISVFFFFCTLIAVLLPPWGSNPLRVFVLYFYTYLCIFSYIL